MAAPRDGADVEPDRFSWGALLPSEAEIAVPDGGVCHSDLHLVDEDRGIARGGKGENRQ